MMHQGENEHYCGLQRGIDDTNYAAGVIAGLSAAMGSLPSIDPGNSNSTTTEPEHLQGLRHRYDDEQARFANSGSKRGYADWNLNEQSVQSSTSNTETNKKRCVSDELIMGSLSLPGGQGGMVSGGTFPTSVVLPHMSSEQFNGLSNQALFEQVQNHNFQGFVRGQPFMPPFGQTGYLPQGLQMSQVALQQAQLSSFGYAQPIMNSNQVMYNSRPAPWSTTQPVAPYAQGRFALPEAMRPNHHTMGLNGPVGGGHFQSFLPTAPVYSDFARSGALAQPTDTMPPDGSRGLPCMLAHSSDAKTLTSHQYFLRHQIEAFEATEDDTTSHVRGRNKSVRLGQVGIRCRHCAHIPAAKRQKGSTYFPAAVLGLYQAAQNMSSTHLQCGLCTEMPESIRQQFSDLIVTKNNSSKAGRSYWAESAKQMGMVDTEDGTGIIYAPSVRK